MKNAVGVILLLLMVAPHAGAETYFFVGSHFPILSEETEDGSLCGIGVDVARRIGLKLGHTFTIRIVPWERAKTMVKTGDADVLIAPFKTPEREKWLDYSATYFFVDRSFFFVKPGSPVTWDGTFASLQGLKIGLVQGWSVGPVFDQAKEALQIDYAPTLDLCFKKLLYNRIDMIPTQDREANAAFKRMHLNDTEKPIAILPELDINYNYFAFSKKKNLSVFKREFDRMLKQMQTSGEIARMLKENYGISGYK